MSEDSPTVLIVDDESDVADAYAGLLGDAYDCRVAYGGAAALELYGPDIDVVLLDRRMPDISGDEVLQEIREREGSARVAMVTAVDPDFDVIEMGFDDYAVKPVSRAELEATVQRLANCPAYAE
jgi:DNA-binding response OmpR family regulator